MPVTPVGAADLGAGTVGPIQQDAGVLEEHLTSGGERHAAWAALEQDNVQVVLKCLNLLRQRRRGDVQPAGGAREVPFLGYGNEVP
ncbi:hypothetical protein GCM10023198_59900 [Promicromonospora umidemergens]|uniref:Uncharacterized protein n=1 Tax=Promicromonospora umidemergens TaxID=629679 RepID=A0ABP8YGD9_9MICO